MATELPFIEMMEIGEVESRAQVQRLIASESFHASELQRLLLEYLAEKSLSGDADHLKEYTVGVEAIGKPQTYDPQHDSSVRVQCSKLRQKLSEYYQGEGRSDAVGIEFPKGRFKLVFFSRHAAAEGSARRIPSMWRLAGVGVIVALAVSVAGNLYLFSRISPPVKDRPQAAQEPTPAIDEFWRPLLGGKGPLTICVGAPMFIRAEPVIVRRPSLDTWDAAVRSGIVERLRKAFPEGGSARPWYIFTGLGESHAALLITNLLAARGVDLRFADSLRLSWHEIASGHLVFIGPPKFIQQLTQLPVEQALVFEGGVVRNLKPLPGEPVTFDEGSTESPDQEGQPNTSGEAHAVISRLPGLHGKGAILVLSGAWTVGTQGAAQYVTHEPYVKDLLARIKLPDGGYPEYYQVLVKTKFRDRTPVKVSYVLHRVLTPLRSPGGG
jgi:hypothetical protein